MKARHLDSESGDSAVPPVHRSVDRKVGSGEREERESWSNFPLEVKYFQTVVQIKQKTKLFKTKPPNF